VLRHSTVSVALGPEQRVEAAQVFVAGGQPSRWALLGPGTADPAAQRLALDAELNNVVRNYS
jgi:hypothetical protein